MKWVGQKITPNPSSSISNGFFLLSSKEIKNQTQNQTQTRTKNAPHPAKLLVQLLATYTYCIEPINACCRLWLVSITFFLCQTVYIHKKEKKKKKGWYCCDSVSFFHLADFWQTKRNRLHRAWRQAARWVLEVSQLGWWQSMKRERDCMQAEKTNRGSKVESRMSKSRMSKVESRKSKAKSRKSKAKRLWRKARVLWT